MNVKAPDRRALGLPKNRRRKPGGVLVFLGVALVAFGAYLAGTNRGESRAERPPATTTSVAAPPGDATTPARAPADQAVGVARTTKIAIPADQNGVAVTLPFTRAGGAYVGAGDRVNLFSIEGAQPGGPATLVLGGVDVLDVSIEVAPRAQSGAVERPSTANVTYLLAVPANETARVITAVQTKTMYVSLLPREARG